MKILSFQIWFNRTTSKADITLLVWPSTLISTIFWIDFSPIAQKIFGWLKKYLAGPPCPWQSASWVTRQCIWFWNSASYSLVLNSSQHLMHSHNEQEHWIYVEITSTKIDTDTKNTDDMSLVSFLPLLWAFSLTKHAPMTRREVMKTAHPGWGGWNRCMVPLVGAHLYC